MPPSGTLEIDLEAFAALPHEPVLIDVREPAEYEAGHVPGAALVPLGTLGTRVATLPRDQVIHVICASGNRSLRAAQALNATGLVAVSVAGGTSAWIRSGRPVVTGGSAR